MSYVAKSPYFLVFRIISPTMCRVINLETKSGPHWRSEARTKENHKEGHGRPDHRRRQPGYYFLKQIEEGAIIQAEARVTVVQLNREVMPYFG